MQDLQSNEDDSVVRYYRTLRDALVNSRREPSLRERRYSEGVERTLKNLAMLLLERHPPKDLDDVRSLGAEFRDAALLFLINEHKRTNSADVLQFYSDRLEELGGAEKVLGDPDIRTIADLIEKLDLEPWRA